MKSSQEKKPEPIESHETETAEDINKEYPFHGYDVGDELVHISGETSYLFPSDGSLIKFESYDYVHGNKANKTAVYKDNNVLVLNMKNPFVKSDEPVKKFATDEGETEENGKQGIMVILYCIAMYCIVLYCIVLYCNVLYCIVLYCIVMYCIVLYCIVLHCIVLYCIVLYCIVLYCIVLYCIELYCIALEYRFFNILCIYSFS